MIMFAHIYMNVNTFVPNAIYNPRNNYMHIAHLQKGVFITTPLPQFTYTILHVHFLAT